jgi:DNA repair protein RecO (recombination protein O)
MRVDSQPAYILHHYPYRDSSEIFELLTRDHGRISVVCRGSRGPRSRFRSVLQPFQPLQVSWSGKGEMPTISTAEPAMSVPLILSGDRLASGFYLNELLMHFLHRHDVQEEIFLLYGQTLHQLVTEADLETILRRFEKNLLQALGLGLNLVADADSGCSVESDQTYLYQVEHGPIRALSFDTSSHLPTVSGASLLALERNESLNESARREIKSLMRYVLGFYLGGKTLKSRELFRL